MADTGGPPRLFSLPRELRDVIYHHLWSSHYILKAQIPNNPNNSKSNTVPADSQSLPLKAYYSANNPASPADTNPHLLPTRHTDPTWLLTCKSVFAEGIEQFLLHVVWFVDEDDLDRPAEEFAPNVLTFPRQTMSPVQMEIRTERWEVIHARLYQCLSLATAFKHHGVKIGRLRIVAVIHSKLDKAFTPKDMAASASHYCGEIMKRFKDVEVKRWQLAAETNLSDQRGYSLYEWTGNSGQIVHWEDAKTLVHEHQTLYQATEGMNESCQHELKEYWKELEDVHQRGAKEAWGGEEEVKYGVRREEKMSTMEFLRARRERTRKIEERRALAESLRLRDL